MASTNQKSADENLIEGELPIMVYFQDKVKLTTHRLRVELSQSDGKLLSSIFLDSITLIQLKSTRQITFAIVGILFLVLAILSHLENFDTYRILFLGFGLLLLILYFFYHNNKLVIYSKGLGKIEFLPSSGNRKQNIEFINAVEQAIYNYKTNKNNPSPTDYGSKTTFKKEDFY